MAKAGLPMEHAREAVSHIDPIMGMCILRLYRSALDIGNQWQPDLVRVRSPGFIFWGAEDTTCPVAFAEELALNTNAGRVLKVSAGHWTIVERSWEIAEALETHWAAVDKTAKQAKGEQQ